MTDIEPAAPDVPAAAHYIVRHGAMRFLEDAERLKAISHDDGPDLRR